MSEDKVERIIKTLQYQAEGWAFFEVHSDDVELLLSEHAALKARVEKLEEALRGLMEWADEIEADLHVHTSSAGSLVEAACAALSPHDGEAK